jgi:hypothetical protein
MFWGTAWNTDTAFTGDRITAMNSLLEGFGGSDYAYILTEYGVTTQSTHISTMIDNSPAPTGDPLSAGLGSYVCSRLTATHHTPDFNAIYIVYVTTPEPGSESGWHSTALCASIRIHTVLVFLVSNVGEPQLYHSRAANGMAQITAHEIAETITDENLGGGWYVTDPSNSEIADKCGFAPTVYVTLHNGVKFLLPQLWSNFAFSKGTGAPGANNEKGCVSSGVQWPHASVSGPAFARQYQANTYTATVTGGRAPYTYNWYFSSGVPTFVLPTGTGPSFTTTLYGWPTGQPETLFTAISDADGRQMSVATSVTSTS